MTRVLVIGARGCLGRALSTQLTQAGHRVRGLDPSFEPDLSPEVEMIRGASSDLFTLERALDDIEVVANLAAIQPAARESERRYFEVNVDALQQLLDACAKSEIHHLVHVSSSIVYGLPIGRPFNEDDPLRPMGAYAASKVEGEHRVALATRRGLSATIIRPRLLMGPGRRGVFERLFNHVKKGLPVPMIGKGNNRFQMTNVDDAARAIVLAMEKRVEGALNIGSDDVPLMKDLLAGLIAHAGSRSVLVKTPARLVRLALKILDAADLSPLGPEHYHFADKDFLLDTTRAKAKLGWSPEVGDLASLIAAYDDYVSPSRLD